MAGAVWLGMAGLAYVYLLAPNTPKLDKPAYLHIPTGSSYEDVMRIMREERLLRSEHTFSVTATLIGYPLAVEPGRYRVESGMSNLKLLFKLRNGLQEPVKLIFTSTRTKEQLAQRLDKQIEPTESELIAAMNDSTLAAEIGVSTETMMTLFIPNTYEVYWNTDAPTLIRKMKAEWDRFWNEKRRAKADSLGLTPTEVTVLASIVEAETYRDDERSRVAGLYLNRLRSGWLLQADPTLIFACKDFSIRRVLKKHKEIDSPYNTYMYPGLPPGPINCPSVASIDAALNPESHDYFFMVARPDFAGYHNFYGEDQYRQHVNAGNRYRRKLDQMNIKN